MLVLVEEVRGLSEGHCTVASDEVINDADSIPDDVSQNSQSSPPDSPTPAQTKKRKKVQLYITQSDHHLIIH